ncbi:type II toxin-antitoxin system RelE/ParE family toxin [Pectobacterium quasiaquaticum]|uniref:Type II toxin-antitoxin system RelE/ParE family toxin n=1 Tax=Pectobacterium quasiaquaticum TaxID=2774015 RepID=A0A9Q2EYY7_9GAMM|nr:MULTISPECIES: type II toxin-antitoxin system RelE/ParE family toxin [Pectobacterium]MBE5203327.1 type II toxin-antitoxin system RelE/ParE family toxin [Pectobacterium quasiaquaticum]MBE5208735.1 type II toxin-antitoxin system RelE/ParE family toxin [Pectobacterium quasiaquaticum]MBE5215254.1 type II toxin-antitoxin system RelE/ParE family toxin [Pectobacterium quasiaquaticum]MBE5221145.1 type II toxin-antitoxin system RelE/ParE family toxin [Pectobacterium quasiaquaticum]MBE5225076.1 type I
MIKVSWSKRALKQLGTIDTRYRKRIKEKVGELSTFPDVNLDLKKLESSGKQYRLRVGDYRIIFQLINDVPQVCEILEVKRRTTTTY